MKYSKWLYLVGPEHALEDVTNIFFTSVSHAIDHIDLTID